MGAHESVRKRERIEEAGAGARHVDRSRPAEAEAVRDERRRWRQEMIGRRGREDEEPDTRRVESGPRQCHLSGLDRDVGKRLVIGGETALADAGAPLDPARLEAKARLDLGICHASLRRIVSEREKC